ncbi:MAG: enoyl-CoA hydratase/isomerase family protein [Candidatus Lokiarchaeota archaeon]|nr:enoyl-CoA hydratase/isomerase family protein [Candidatus Lokiarchaeota archaeon]
MSDDRILFYEVKGRVAQITLNRPKAAHSFNLPLMKKLHESLLTADQDERVKCILLKSTGNKVFSSGIDIKSTTPGDLEYLESMRIYGRKNTQYMLLMKKPIVVQVQGTAIGYGMELIMASDLRIFADKPKEEMFFRMPEIAISIYPQTGATILPLLSFGLSYAKNILFTADEFGLEELKNLNFPTRIFSPDKLEIETKKFIRTFSKRMESFMFLVKSSLTLMNNKMIERWYDLEDKCGEIAYQKKSQKEMEEFIKNLYEKYP